VIEVIKTDVEQDNFKADDALLLLYISMMIKKMSNYPDASLKSIAMSSGEATIKACMSYQKQATKKQEIEAVEVFKAKNKIKILNDLTSLEKYLLRIYQDVDIEVHRDN
jgi:hypothetical protein